MLIPVILAGGAGTRLWPVSREMHPKPYIKLSDGQSLLQKTVSRVVRFQDIPEVLTVTNQEFYFKTKDEYSPFRGENVRFNFLLEPVGRNTAPAIGMAALYALETYGKESILLVLPADHLLSEQAPFDYALTQASQIAKDNKIVTFGTEPTHPATCFGYIKYDAFSQEKTIGSVGYKVEKFVEKPSKIVAEEYLASKEYLWNSGMFCFKATTILSELERLEPLLFQQLHVCWEASKNKNFSHDAIVLDEITFSQIPSQSIDYAIMEEAENVVVIPCDFDWSDIGSWNSMSDLLPPDADGNRTMGDTLLMNSSNSYIQANDRLVATLGIDNLMIIDTPDALLVANREHAQDVRKIVDKLKENNHNTYKDHLTIFRPWGSYTILEESRYFKIKRIVVKPQAALSLQLHHYRSEHWIVVSGTAKVTNGDTTFMLHTNESTFIPIRNKHRLENPGSLDLIIIEIQTGEYLGEDDIVRVDDIYGRVSARTPYIDTNAIF